MRKILLAALLMIAACGHNALRADSTAGLDFWNGNIRPDLDYYTFSRGGEPEAIIGVDRNLVFENSSLWQPVSPRTPENLSTLAQMMYYRVQSGNNPAQGYDMFDDRGRWVGQWYSPGDLNTIISSRGGNRIYIAPPSPVLPSQFTAPTYGLQPGQY